MNKLLLRIYIFFQELFHEYLNINLKGFDFFINLAITRDTVIDVKGRSMFVNYKIANNYLRLYGNRYNEPETHVFINSLQKVYSKGFVFADIGANIGEFILDYTDRDFIDYTYGFEPQSEQFKALNETVKINNFKNITLINSPVSNASKEIIFNEDKVNSTSSGILRNSNINGISMTTTTLDQEIHIEAAANLVLLIDVEGFEKEVIEGAHHLIQKNRPIIIFEYNHVSKAHFTLEEIDSVLPEYEIFRLNRKGKLDSDFNSTWNCVAIPQELKKTLMDRTIIV